MQDDVTIRDYRESDADALGKLDASFTSDRVYTVTVEEDALHLASVPALKPTHKRYSIADEQSWTHGFVACEGDRLRGFVATKLETWNRRLVVCHFYVDSHCRRRGIGRRLMDHALEHGHRCGALTAWVETSNLNYPGVQAYLRLGFSLCGFDTSTYVGTPAEGEVALFLSRSLRIVQGIRGVKRPT